MLTGIDVPAEQLAAQATHRPSLGIQGPVVGWQDPWAGQASDSIMRTGTGVLLDSQDGWAPPEQFLALLNDLGAEFYLHHVIPTLQGQSRMIEDVQQAGLSLVLGNEYGNINGPYVPGTNRYDVPDQLVVEAAQAGILLGLLYDEPEHLQINATQYRKDAFLPHFGTTDGLDSQASEKVITRTIAERAKHLADLLPAQAASGPVSLLSEQVFPVMFHTFARAGMTPCPKVMKESFQPLQLSTALGAALQYNRQLWVCADLWGPDVGPWFTRAPGFPGHSPREYAASLRMAYLFGPSHLFTENIDVLAHYTGEQFKLTEFGDVWLEFVRDFIPAHPLTWSFRDAHPTTVLIHAEDSNFGRGVQPFGNRTRNAADESASIFAAWHLLSRGTIPRNGTCGHIPGYERSPRAKLNDLPRNRFPLDSGVPVGASATQSHPLFHALNNTIVYDENIREDQLGYPALIMAAGSRLPSQTVQLLRNRARAGATVVIAEWLASPWTHTEAIGNGSWVVTSDFGDDDVLAAIEPHLPQHDLWTQRFGSTIIRFTPSLDDATAIDFEVASPGESGPA